MTSGEEGIRTLDTVSRIHTFQACLFNHSSTSPFKWGAKVIKNQSDLYQLRNILAAFAVVTCATSSTLHCFIAAISAAIKGM